jgi:hypothetical protein
MPFAFVDICLRIRVLYNGEWAVQAFVLVILFTFIGVNSWLLANGVRTSVLKLNHLFVSLIWYSH